MLISTLLQVRLGLTNDAGLRWSLCLHLLRPWVQVTRCQPSLETSLHHLVGTTFLAHVVLGSKLARLFQVYLILNPISWNYSAHNLHAARLKMTLMTLKLLRLC
jgi:hypothetical protein